MGALHRRFGGLWQSRTGRWSRAGSCPPPAAPTWTPSCTRTSGECSVRAPPAPPSRALSPQNDPERLPRSAGAPGAAARAGCPHGHLQTLPGGQERRRQDSAGGLAGRDPRARRPPRDPGHRGHHETLGIEATTLFWPAKPRGSGRPVLFQLHLWDCGDGALRKFEHLLPACKEEADAALFLFSFTDRASFEELPALMGRVLGPGDRHLVRVVVGTKYPFGGPQRSPRGGGIAPPGLSALGIAGAENGTTMDSLLLLIFTEFWGFFRCSFTPPPAVPEWVRTRRFLSIWYLSRLRMCTNGYTNGFTVPAYF
ncbi:ciliogenesis and planar polarity effector 2 isoform X6 [Serinus canaria]|uniref:ciliogenesis and planar polarity effector 2 isoform X6 n=1 Tax=Serinus canaria TaxID=9135 RepID=UPI0021CCDB2E|nr:ciliogenesis and planar polarity effector 2 isoform X6 [Serinus canaria]